MSWNVGQVVNLTVDADEDDTRLDRWLKRKFHGLTQGQVSEACGDATTNLPSGLRVNVCRGRMIVVRPPQGLGGEMAAVGEALVGALGEPGGEARLWTA